MGEPTPYEDQQGYQTIPICQKCFEAAATIFCEVCGCPLCYKCSKKHPCKKDTGHLPN